MALTVAVATLFPGICAARQGARTVAVLEFRAGASGAQGVAQELAEQLARLTSNRVVSPRDARRSIGPSLDAAVARCAGAPACVADLGNALGCQEVILVGVSQLGDIILAVQRIDVSRGVVVTRLADSIRPGRRVDPEAIAAYLRRLLPPEQFRRFGRVVVRTAEAGDEVYVDGKLRGRTPLPPLRVAAPARIKIRVARQGHQDFVARLDVVPDASVEVKATLGRSGAQAPRWYQRWWVWAMVGGVVAAGAVTAAAVAASDGPDRVPAVVRLPPLTQGSGALVSW